MPRSRKIDLQQVRASLDKTRPKCGFTITPDQVKRVDFERVDPKPIIKARLGVLVAKA